MYYSDNVAGSVKPGVEAKQNQNHLHLEKIAGNQEPGFDEARMPHSLVEKTTASDMDSIPWLPAWEESKRHYQNLAALLTEMKKALQKLLLRAFKEEPLWLEQLYDCVCQQRYFLCAGHDQVQETL